MDNLIGTPPNHAVPHKYIDMEQMEYLCHLNRFSKLSDDFLINGPRDDLFTYKYVLDGSFSNLQHLLPKGQLQKIQQRLSSLIDKNKFHCFHIFLLKLCSIENIPVPNADYAFFDDEMPFTLTDEQIENISFLNAYHKEKKGNNDIVTFDFMSYDHHHNFSTTIALTNDSFHISSINNHNAQVIFDENVLLYTNELPESSQWCYQLIKNMISLHCRYNNNFKVKKTCSFDFKNKSFCHSSLQYKTFIACLFSHANMKCSTFHDINFDMCEIKNCNFDNSEMNFISCVGTNFSGSTFNNVKTTTAQLIKTPTKWTNNTLKYWFSSSNKRNIIFTLNTISDRDIKLKCIKDILLSLVDQKANIYSVRQELLDFLNNDLYKNDGEILSYKESIMLFCAV
ncbi:TPA: type III effector protein [Escherichia coli]|nr:pentapeptide repeat-containing protein [Escherichia coli]HDP9338603.1 type III effector protein [Escherichia coli]HDQ1158228.1 type III effector protein [Escherichia coli]HDQ1498060.1 type III effector protein [Escherichia coli]HDQ1648146.1 type III effector protein [Escherichia coli]